MTDNPYESPDTPGEALEPKPAIRRPRVVEVLAAVAVIGIVVALLLPSVRVAREPARRMSCANNLKNIVLALQNYHEQYDSFPPAYTVDEAGKPLHSWRTLILPFIEQQAAYEKIDLAKPWDDPANQEVFQTVISLYRCPSVKVPAGHTTYLAVVAEDGSFPPGGTRTLAEMTDDHGLTLLIIEVDAEHAVPWMSPSDADEGLLRQAVNAAQPPHQGGLQGACANCQVLFLRTGTKPETVRALVSINGGDDDVAQQAR